MFPYLDAPLHISLFLFFLCSSFRPSFLYDSIRKDSILKVALYAGVEVQPLAAYFGGVVAQEVVKVTGKYTPLDQWLHLDFLEVRTIHRSSSAVTDWTTHDWYFDLPATCFEEQTRCSAPQLTTTVAL